MLIWEGNKLESKRYTHKPVACVASVSVWFRSKEKPRKRTFGFDRAREMNREPKCEREGRRHFSRGL